MDTPYSWHPGTVRVAATGWAIPVELLPDELFSSWLVRTALANGCDPLTFTGLIWQKWRVWTGDVDRHPPTDRLSVISKMGNIPVDAFAASTLSPLVRRAFGELPRNESAWPWILAIGARNRRRSGGLQYCPICLKDATPYFRLQWRLAWHTGCDRHGCRLEGRCPACGAPIEPHRLSVNSGSIVHCATCRSSLSNAETAPLSELALKFQSEADAVATNGKAWFDSVEVNAGDWFALARFYAGLVRRMSRQETAWVVSVAHSLGIQDTNALSDPAPLELLRTSDRAILLDGVSRLLDLPTEQLGALLAERNVSRQALFPKGVSIPALLRGVADDLADKPITRSLGKALPNRGGMPAPRPRREIERMMFRLRRKMAQESM